MARALRVSVALALAAGGVLAALYGLALVLFGNDSPGADPFMEIGDRKLGADSFGGAVLTLGVAAILLGVLLARGRPRG
jgi:hypothetical protein